MEIAGLKRELRLWDVILFNIVAILGLRWIPIAAAAGYVSLTLWVLAILLFFLPQGFAVAELSTRHPEEGGIYSWTKKAFGDFHGFICGWCYWGNNLSYYPSLLISAAGISALIGGDKTRHLSENHIYVGVVALTILWIAVISNVLGVRRGKWVQNIGAFATWLPGAVLILLGLFWLTQHPAANTPESGELLPSLNRTSLSLWSSLCFALAGLELPSTMGGEIHEPRRTIPRALWISAGFIVFIYILATASVMVILPHSEISIITGAVEAISRTAEKFNLMYLGGAMALFITLGHFGGVGAWIAGSARVPFVAGLDRHLPGAFGKLHPRWGTPHVALLTQGVIATILLLLSFMGETVKGAYLALLDMTIIVYFIPYLYMFAALPKLSRAAADEHVVHVPGGSVGRWTVALLGIASVLIAIALAVVPPPDVTDILSFELKVVGGTLAFVGVGVAFYAICSRTARP